MAGMNLQKWSDVSQIVGALAVVASLIYVGIEIRSNTEATQAATRQAALQADIEYLGSVLDPATLLRAEVKLNQGLELSPEEQYVLIERQHVNFRVFENAFYQYSYGLLVPERWETYRRIIETRFRNYEPTRTMWANFGANFDEGFRVEVESIRAELSESGRPNAP